MCDGQLFRKLFWWTGLDNRFFELVVCYTVFNTLTKYGVAILLSQNKELQFKYICLLKWKLLLDVFYLYNSINSVIYFTFGTRDNFIHR